MSDDTSPPGMPSPLPGGGVPTMNRMGAMASELYPFSSDFVDFCSHAAGPVLDVGAAYGAVALRALGAGARVIANDLDPRHLQILWEQAPPRDRAKLSLQPGAFPDELEFAPGSLAAAHVARVLHFLDGDAIDRGFARLFEWLAPAGKVFGLASTPFSPGIEPFVAVYEVRRQIGVRWPGVLRNQSLFDASRGALLPDYVHYLDPDVLRRSLQENGFIVERVEYVKAGIVRPNLPGEKACVGFIATKPCESRSSP